MICNHSRQMICSSNVMPNNFHALTKKICMLLQKNIVCKCISKLHCSEHLCNTSQSSNFTIIISIQSTMYRSLPPSNNPFTTHATPTGFLLCVTTTIWPLFIAKNPDKPTSSFKTLCHRDELHKLLKTGISQMILHNCFGLQKIPKLQL